MLGRIRLAYLTETEYLVITWYIYAIISTLSHNYSKSAAAVSKIKSAATELLYVGKGEENNVLYDYIKSMEISKAV